jgi:hypothetical protein
MTTEEQERNAYQAGDTTLANALARIVDLQHALGQATADNEDMRTALVAARTLLTREGASKRALDVIQAALE